MKSLMRKMVKENIFLTDNWTQQKEITTKSQIQKRQLPNKGRFLHDIYTSDCSPKNNGKDGTDPAFRIF